MERNFTKNHFAMSTIPYYWRLSLFYLVFFSTIGMAVPYWSLYLQDLGFDAAAIGELTAILSITRIIAPYIWGWLADHYRQHVALVRLSSLLTLITFSGMLLGHSYHWLAGITFIYSFFWNATLPQFEATTLAHLGNQPHRYSQIRLWGSIGFIITVTLVSWLFEYVAISFLPFLLLASLTIIWLTSLFLPRQPITVTSTNLADFYQTLRQPSMLAIFSVIFLLQASHGPYYTFYTPYLESHGYPLYLIGQLWAMGVVAELMIFFIMHRLLIHFRLTTLLIISLTLTSLRWLIIGYLVEFFAWLLLAQLLHAASFALIHGINMQLIRRHFTDAHQGKAQALYNSIGFGAGGVVGSIVSGYTWQLFGAQITYLWAMMLGGIAIAITWRWIAKSEVG
jgi:PPP family 3-phenylpropionic acid transporter